MNSYQQKQLNNELFNKVFQDIKGYEGLYKISKNGEIWSCKFNQTKIPQLSRGKYYINLMKNKIDKKYSIEKLLELQYKSNSNLIVKMNNELQNEIFNKVFEDLKDYDGLYKISKNGEIWSYVYKKIMTPTLDDGYHKINLQKHTKSHKCSIHRLLALQYIPNLENKEEVDHIDKNRLNNSLDNLRWVSRIENMNNRKDNLNLLSETQLEQRKEEKKIYLANYHKTNYPKQREELGITPRSEMTKTQEPNYDRDKTREYRARLTEEQKEKNRQKKREKYANGGKEKQQEYLKNKKSK
tara:strand:+ start:1948 stop:2838 length:891 start_codon:yes stop_codon:yes gene_type:complete